MSQTHGSNLWPEPPSAGATPAIAAAYWVKDGADWLPTTTGPEEGAFFLVGSDYLLIDLTPIAGVYYDSGGTAQAINIYTTPRLHGVQVGGGDMLFY